MNWMYGIDKQLKIIRYFLQKKRFSDAAEELSAIEMVFENSLISRLDQCILQKDRSGGILLIDEYFTTNVPVNRQEKINSDGLKTSLILLETELSVLLHKKADLLKLIKTYRIRYNGEIAGIVGKLLRLKTEILYKQHLHSPEAEYEYKKSEKSSEEFFNAFREQKEEKLFSLTAYEKKELQFKFRRASKLCHPDLVTDKLKEHATKIFVELNKAYYMNDLKKVVEILEILESKENYFSKITEEVSEIDSLVHTERKLRSDIVNLKQEIKSIETSQAFRTIKDLKNWDTHFIYLKEKFEAEIIRLKEENKDV